MLSDSKGRMSAQVTARWRSEERRMRYLLLPEYQGLVTRAGIMRKERRKGICILGDVMMTEFERGSPDDTCGEGLKLRTLAERSCQEGEFWTLEATSAQESM